MDQKYQTWINERLKDEPNGGYGQCAEVTLEMQAVFPELQRVRGHYYCITWGERGHWWLQTEAGEIVDPTAAQFPSKGTGIYVPLDENAEEPVGMCLNCGEYVFESTGVGSEFCSKNCDISYRAYINSFLR